MDRLIALLRPYGGYLVLALFSCAGAAILTLTPPSAPLPVLGTTPPLPLTLLAAALGLPLLHFLRRNGIAPPPRPPGLRDLPWLLALGAALALAPAAIDLIVPFPRDINLALPGALAFYPAIALVAEVVFHLVPLALLTAPLPRSDPLWRLVPVALVEPLFQVLFLSGPMLQGVLVLANVTLISALQLWLFRRRGFAAMMALRLSFYLFWHILWGTARLPLLF